MENLQIEVESIVKDLNHWKKLVEDQSDLLYLGVGAEVLTVVSFTARTWVNQKAVLDRAMALQRCMCGMTERKEVKSKTQAYLLHRGKSGVEPRAEREQMREGGPRVLNLLRTKVVTVGLMVLQKLETRQTVWESIVVGYDHRKLLVELWYPKECRDVDMVEM